MDHFCLKDMDIKKALQPQFVLDVEMHELGINAGLQDRVVQIYEGLVYMDFSKDLFTKNGHGTYRRMDPKGLPQLWLAYVADPSDSGKIHNDVRKRYEAGDAAVVSGMRTFAAMTDQARVAMEKGQHAALSELMAKNFALRRSLYGDACLGADNLRMIQTAAKFNCCGKFSGSGGAVVGSCKPNQLAALGQAFEEEGFVFVALEPHCPQGPALVKHV